MATTMNSSSLKRSSGTTATAAVSWDDQTANRFNAFRTSLQHSLIDSTLPAANDNNNTSSQMFMDISPFSPTRASSTISAQNDDYGRSQSDGADLPSSVAMPSLALQPSGGNNNYYNSSANNTNYFHHVCCVRR
jgi:hypothetical protein